MEMGVSAAERRRLVNGVVDQLELEVEWVEVLMEDVLEPVLDDGWVEV